MGMNSVSTRTYINMQRWLSLGGEDMGDFAF